MPLFESTRYLKGETQFIQEQWLKHSWPLKTERIILGHRIFSNGVSFNDLMRNFAFGYKIILSYLVTLVVLTAVFLVLSKVTFKIRFRNKRNIISNFFVLMALFVKNQRRFVYIRCFCLFLTIFFWFSLLFVTNNIKTNKVSEIETETRLDFLIDPSVLRLKLRAQSSLKFRVIIMMSKSTLIFVSDQVVVDGSELIKNEEDIMSTRLVHCWLESETELNLALQSPRSSLLSRIYHEKSKLFQKFQFDLIWNSK